MKKILVVVDMQNDFIDGALGTAEAVGIVDKVVEGFRPLGNPPVNPPFPNWKYFLSLNHA